MSNEPVKCACKDCTCKVAAEKAVTKDGQAFCCDECASGHVRHAGCDHAGGACRGGGLGGHRTPRRGICGLTRGPSFAGAALPQAAPATIAPANIAPADIAPADTMPAAPSPCRGICRLDETGFCLGCRRTGAEIFAWGGMSEGERRVVLDRLARTEAS